MKYLFGLGNPGTEYQLSRHNAGFLLADRLQQSWNLPDFKLQPKLQAEVSKHQQLIVAKPQTFMNASGKAVQAVVAYYNDSSQTQFDQIFIAHDDLDLALGSYKIQFGKGPKVHNGVTSVVQYLKSDQFWHVRIGIDTRHNDRSISSQNYVLLSMSQDERQLLHHTLKEIADQLTSSLLENYD